MSILNETDKYLRLIHPTDGSMYVAMLLPNSKGWWQTIVKTNLDALATIKKCEESKPIGVYISQASFMDQTKKRDAASAEKLNCLFIDLDVGDGTNKYTLKSDALKALKNLEIVFAPATAVVDTGGGLHAYWRLKEHLAKGDWLTLAGRFKRALAAAGFLADPAVTADAARVLRVPGTTNRKYRDDRVCTFVSMDPEQTYSTTEIEAALEKFKAQDVAKTQPLRVTNCTSSKLSVKPRIAELPFTVPDYLLDSIVHPVHPPAPSAEDVERACPSINSLAATGGTTEHAWSLGIINTAMFTTDPESTAQRWSKAYRQYQAVEVSQKLAIKQQSNSAPTSCEKMATLDEACAVACKGCPYRGKAASPIHAAQKLAYSKQLLITAVAQNSNPARNNLVIAPMLPVALDPTDSGNAAWLHNTLGGNIRWIHGEQKFLEFIPSMGWTGRTQAEMKRICELAMRNLGVVGCQSFSAAEIKRLGSHIEKSLSARGLENSVELLKGQPGVQVYPNQLNANDMLLGLRGGIVFDLATGICRQQLANDLITKSAGCSYDPAATCPQWEAFLKSIFQGDQDLIDYLQHFAGYCLTGNTREQQMLFAYGLGANGKSVLFSILMELMGTYATAAPVETFMMQANEGAKSHLLARLSGARLVIANETADNQALAENLIKEITGGETMAAAAKYKEAVEFKPKLKLIIVGNHKPRINGTDGGIWRRINLLPFERVFAAKEQDRDLFEKLRSELPGILNWALVGCTKWQKGGLQIPEKMQNEVKEYRSDSDVIGQWISEQCQLSASVTATASALYMNYKNWCETNGHRAASSTQLGKRLAERGLKKEKSGTVTWRGVGIRQGALFNDPSQCA